MTIPGRGDLVPRRHRQRPGRIVAAVVALLAVAGVGYAGFALFGGGSSSKNAAPPIKCPAVKPFGPTAPGKVHLVVLNGTLTSGLAAQVEGELKHRGFHVTSVGNTEKLLTGVATVSYGPGRILAAQAVADQVEGAKLVKGTVAGVQLSVGEQYQSLATRSQASAARAQFVATDANLAPSPTPTPTAKCTS